MHSYALKQLHEFGCDDDSGGAYEQDLDLSTA